METSILKNVKKVCGLPDDYTPFDEDILMYINGTLSKLNQLGIGPADGFQIEDASSTWTDFVGTDPRYNLVKTFVQQSVRLAFDPPATSFHIDALKAQIQEAEWRLSVTREGDTWIDPDPPVPSVSEC